MQEYFNLDIENNFSLKSPQEIKNNEDSAILSSCYQNNKGCGDDQITIITPPLRCSKVRVWPGKNDKFSKCFIQLETTDNEWRFTQFLLDLSDKCRYLITENAKKCFKYTFSATSMHDSYSNLFLQKNYKHNEPENIQIQLGKNLLNDLNKQVAKSYKNQYLVLRLVFKGVLISNGVFSEVWRADQIYKAKPIPYDSDESEINDEEYEDIGETISIKPNTSINNEKEIKTDQKVNSTIDKQKDTEIKIEKLGDNELCLNSKTVLENDTSHLKDNLKSNILENDSINILNLKKKKIIRSNNRSRKW